MSGKPECGICKRFPNQPTSPMCGHIFCLKCLYDGFEAAKDSQYECPICNKPAKRLSLISVYIPKDDQTHENENKGDRTYPPYGKWTALHTAARFGNFDELKTLVAFGQDLHERSDENTFGKCAIHLASLSGHLDIVRYFLSKDSTLEFARCASQGLLPIHSAVLGGKDEVVKYLLSRNNTDIDVTNIMHGRTLLHCASDKGNLDLVKWLVAKGANPEAKSNANDLESMPIHLAALSGHLDIVKYFIEGINEGYALARNKNGEIPMLRSAYSGRLDVMKYFVEIMGIEVDFRCDVFGYTSLMDACEFGYLDLVEYLIQKGADARVIDGEGNTTLHLAAANGNIDVVKYLVSQLPSLVVAKNRNGKSALDYAKISTSPKAKDVVQYLK